MARQKKLLKEKNRFDAKVKQTREDIKREQKRLRPIEYAQRYSTKEKLSNKVE